MSPLLKPKDKDEPNIVNVAYEIMKYIYQVRNTIFQSEQG
jgi:hypothetical protein